jgi:hypothetical protein
MYNHAGIVKILKICVKNTPCEINSLSAPLKSAIIGNDAAEGIAASKTINTPNKESKPNLYVSSKKSKGNNINLRTLASAKANNLLRIPSIRTLANHEPNMSIDKTKLVSPTIFKGEIIRNGMRKVVLAYSV